MMAIRDPAIRALFAEAERWQYDANFATSIVARAVFLTGTVPTRNLVARDTSPSR